MEYSISQNEQQQIAIDFSMGHEALGRWFNDELGHHIENINKLLETVLKIEAKESLQYQQQGREFRLLISDDEVEILANSLDMETELPENTELYESELRSACGLADFKDVLLEWRHFINTHDTK